MAIEPDNTRSVTFAGVIDSVVPRADFVGAQSAIEYGPAATGFLSTIGPFHVLPFEAALRAIAVRGEHNNIDEDIDPRRVLAQPWHYDRMCDAITKQPKSVPPSIRVNRYRVVGFGDYYSVSNGMHRTFAARCYGADAIKARIVDTWICDPSAFYLYGSRLYNMENIDPTLVSDENPLGIEIISAQSILSVDLLTILQCLGCKTDAPLQRDFTFPPLKFSEDVDV